MSVVAEIGRKRKRIFGVFRAPEGACLVVAITMLFSTLREGANGAPQTS